MQRPDGCAAVWYPVGAMTDEERDALLRGLAVDLAAVVEPQGEHGAKLDRKAE